MDENPREGPDTIRAGGGDEGHRLDMLSDGTPGSRCKQIWVAGIVDVMSSASSRARGNPATH